MINIVFKNNSLIVSGHAFFAKKNHDIVCAGVSAIVLGSIYHWQNHPDLWIEQNQQNATIKITFLNQCLEKDANLLAELYLIFDQLKILQQHYSQYLKLKI